jgi:hypothetical protein
LAPPPLAPVGLSPPLGLPAMASALLWLALASPPLVVVSRHDLIV